MPTFKVTSPDGQLIEVDAPATASDDQLVALAQQKLQTDPVERPQPTVGQRFLGSAAGRVVKGMKDPIDAGAQLLPRALSQVASGFGNFPNRASDWLDSEAKQVDTGIADSEREYQTARWATGQSGFDGARLTGNIVSPANVAVGARLPQGASLLGRAFNGAKAGAVGGAMQPITDQGADAPSFAMQKTGQSLVGAAGGAIFSPIIGKAADLLLPRLKALASSFTNPEVLGARAGMEADSALAQVFKDLGVNASTVPQHVMADLRQKVLDSFKQGQKLDAPAQLRKMDFDAQGVPALRGQITRDPRQYSAGLNVRGIEGVGEPVQDVLNAQNQKITSGIGSFGGPAAQDRGQAGGMFVGALQKLDDRLSGEVRRAYQNARGSSGKDWDVPMQKLAGGVADVLDTFGIGAEKNAVPSAIASKLKSFGIVNDPAMTQRKVFNYEEADKLLKQINAHDDGQNASIGALRAAVKGAITEGGGEGDPFGVARNLAASRFQLMDAVPALEAVVKGKASPDDFVQKFIVNGKTKDLQKLVDVLPSEAVQEAKKQIARVIYDGAFKGNATGDKLASPSGLQSAIKGIGTDKLKLFFSDAELDQLNRLNRITAYANTEPAWGTVARGGNPGGVLFGSLSKLSGVPGIGHALPMVSALQQAQRASTAMNTAVPKATNLSPEEIRLVSGLLGTANVAAGGLLAPGP